MNGEELLTHLRHYWPAWVELSTEGQERIRQTVRERGRDWEKMTEEERERFIDAYAFEGLPCNCNRIRRADPYRSEIVMRHSELLHDVPGTRRGNCSASPT
jgi:hypothetical protein